MFRSTGVDVVRSLDKVIHPVTPSPGLAGPNHRSRALQRRFTEGDPAAVRLLRDEYDEQAAGWLEWINQPDYLAALLDGLHRGLEPLPPGGLVLEVGAGAGPATDVLRKHFARVIALDVSARMFTRTGAGTWRVLADVSLLPLRADSVALVVGLNAVPDWLEFARVLGPSGQLLWASSFGAESPVYTEPGSVAAAFPARHAVSAAAGHGDWTVVMPQNIQS
jgi:SAM-dependent methyltransferase